MAKTQIDRPRLHQRRAGARSADGSFRGSPSQPLARPGKLAADRRHRTIRAGPGGRYDTHDRRCDPRTAKRRADAPADVDAKGLLMIRGAVVDPGAGPAGGHGRAWAICAAATANHTPIRGCCRSRRQRLAPLAAPPRHRHHAVHGSGLRHRGLPLRSRQDRFKLIFRSASLHVGDLLYAARHRLYAINDRAAGRRKIELDLMTAGAASNSPKRKT